MLWDLHIFHILPWATPMNIEPTNKRSALYIEVPFLSYFMCGWIGCIFYKTVSCVETVNPSKYVNCILADQSLYYNKGSGKS